MWPFRKKSSQPLNLPIEGPWSVSHGENEGKAAIVRTNSGYKEFVPLAGYEHQLGIAVPFRAPEPTGLPSPEENMQLGDLEDALCDSLQIDAESLFVATITTSGMKEFVFYTKAPEQVKERFEAVRSTITSHELQFMIQPDKQWETYAQLA